MALINSDGKYIKINIEGEFTIYASAEARDRIKNSTSYEIILDKYLDIPPTFLSIDISLSFKIIIISVFV